MTSYNFQIKYCLWQCLILSYTSTWHCWGSIVIWTFASLNLWPKLGAYQGDGLITLTDFRYLTALDQARLEGVIKGKVLDLARLVGGLIKGKVRSCSVICASTQSPPVQTFPRHQLQLLQNTSPLQVFTKLQYLLHQTDLLQNLDRRAIN